MKYNNIIYKDKKLKRITEKKVNNIINNPSKNIGLIIYTLPVNANPDSQWINGFFEIEIDTYNDSVDYMTQLNEIKYYNCNDPEMGYYLKYYIEEV